MSEEASPSNTGETGETGTPTAPRPRDAQNQPQLGKEGQTLDVFFPIPHSFTCPIDKCGVRYSGISWTSRRQSLVQHLLDEHELKVKVAYTCTLCSTTGLGLHPTLHSCISRGRHELSPLDLYRHKCPECPATMTTRKGLDNHMRKHKRQEAQRRNEQPTTARTSKAAPAATPTGRLPPRCCRQPSPTDKDPSIVTELQLNDFNGTIAQREQHDTERNTGLSNTNRAGTHTFLPPLLGDLQEIPDEVSATTGTPSPTPSEASTARSRSSCASLFSQVGNASSITPSPRQHESPHSDTDHDNPRRSRPPSPNRPLTPLPPLLGSIAGSPSQNSRDATIPSATSEEESPPEGSWFSSRLQQDPDAACATQRTSQQGAPQHSLDTAQGNPQPSPSARSITHSVDSHTPPTSSEGLSIDDAGGESQDPAPQTVNTA
ncbi:hypothetical protein MRX96_018178 [Rhipicephalus microplus]